MAISGWKTSFLVGAVFLLGLADMIRHEASGQPTHFQLPMSRTGNDATVLIPGTANPNIGGVRLEPGDEIAVVSSSGLLVGHTIWNGASAGITIWGDDDQTPELDGLNKDEPFTFILWDKSDNRLYSSVKVTFDPAFQTRMSYRPDAIFILTSLSAGDYELGMVTIEDRLLSPGAPPVLIDLNKALFADGKRVRITYLARSSNEHVASVKIDQSQLWVSPIAEGSARITVIVIDEEGASRATSFEMTVTTRAEIPVTFKIHPNYPNPLKTSTRIRFDLPEIAEIAVRVYDLTGRLISTKEAIPYPAGENQELELDMRYLRSGLYLYHLDAAMPGGRRRLSGYMIVAR